MDETTTALSHERTHSERPPTLRVRGRRGGIGLFLLILTILFFVVEYALTNNAFVETLLVYIATMLPLFMLIVSIRALREDHADEVYLLWFIFFFLTYVILGIYYYLTAAGVISWTSTFDHPPWGLAPVAIDQSRNVGTLTRLLLWYIGLSTDLGGEIFFLCTLMGLVVVPQFLSFVISGLFGCAKPPVLVSKVTRFVTLSLVKFFCGLAAVDMSANLFRLYGDYVDFSDLIKRILVYKVISDPLFGLALSFSIAAVYYRSAHLLGLLIQKGTTVSLIRVLNHYMTRFTIR